MEFLSGLNSVKSKFEAKGLPLDSRRLLCEDLLQRFGVTTWQPTRKHELIHSCPLPYGRHANGDRRASASLNYEELVFKCLGCGAAGGLLWFIGACGAMDQNEAYAWLEGQTGLGQTEMELPTLLAIIDAAYAPRSARRERMPRFDRAMLDTWTAWPHPHPMLTDVPTAQDPPGLAGRGIPEQTLRDFRVGYDPEYAMAIVGGQVTATQPRIVIPHLWDGELVGWQARRVEPQHEPKFKSSPDFPRDRTFFNPPVRRRGTAVVVESPMSVLRHYHHQPALVATFGAAVSEDQIKLLADFDEVRVWLDNDEAGWEGTDKLIEGLQRHCALSIVASDLDADPADLPDDLVDAMIGNAVPWPIWQRPNRLQDK